MTTTTPTPSEPMAGSPDGPSAFGRIAGISGIVFAVAIIASQFLVGSMPTAGDDATAIREYFADNEGPHRIGLVVVGLAIVPLILFATGLARSQRRAERDSDGWSSAVGAFFVYAAAMYTSGLVIDAGLLLSYDSGLSDELLLSLWDVSMAATPVMALGFGAAATCVAIGALTQRNRPQWYGGLGLLAGVGAVVGMGTLVSDSDGVAGLGFVMLPVFMLWVIASGVFLYREA
jgi:hypothetical protein